MNVLYLLLRLLLSLPVSIIGQVVIVIITVIINMTDYVAVVVNRISSNSTCDKFIHLNVTKPNPNMFVILVHYE